MNNYAQDKIDEEEISLFDIWQKIVQHKKVFFSVFFAVFIGGSIIVMLIAPKYNFSQVIEMSNAPDERGNNTVNANVEDVLKKMNNIYIPAAIRSYNLQAAKKIKLKDIDLTADYTGHGTMILSVTGPLKDLGKYTIIFQKIFENYASDTKEYVDFRKKTLINQEAILKRYLTNIYKFYDTIFEKKFNNAIVDNLNNQNAVIISSIINNLNALQAQISITHNAKVISGVIISDEPIGASKIAMIILTTIVAFVFAFFGVFVADFITNSKNHYKKLKTTQISN